MRADETAGPEREAYRINDHHVVAGVQPQHEVKVEAARNGRAKRAHDGDERARGHLSDNFRLVLADVLVYGYGQHEITIPSSQPNSRRGYRSTLRHR